MFADVILNIIIQVFVFGVYYFQIQSRMRSMQELSAELSRQQNLQFYKVPNSLISVEEDSKQTRATLFSPMQTCSSLTANSKINAILIPDYTYLLAKIGRKKDNTQEDSKTDKRIKRKMSVDMEVSPIFDRQWTNMEAEKMSSYLADRSFIQKYLWDTQSSKNSSQKYNIVYQQNPQVQQLSQAKNKSEHQIVAPLSSPPNPSLRHQKTTHCYSIINRPGLHKQMSSPYGTERSFDTLGGNESSLSQNTNLKLRKDIARDTNINVWHTHGLKFGSDVLRMGLRNKNIVFVVHHNIQTLEMSNQRIQLRRQIYENSKYELQWSNFIRESNDKCIIVHLFIKEAKNTESKCITINQIPNRDKEYKIQFNVDHPDCTDLGNRDRLLFIVDHLLEKQLEKEAFNIASNRSYSSIVKRTSKSQSKSAQISRKNSETIMFTPKKKQKKDLLSIIQSESEQRKSKLPSQIPAILLDYSNPKQNPNLLKSIQIDPKRKPHFIQNQFNKKNLKFKSSKPFFLDVENTGMKKKKKISVVSQTVFISKKPNKGFSFIQWLCGSSQNPEQNTTDESNKSKFEYQISNDINKPYKFVERRGLQRNMKKRN